MSFNELNSVEHFIIHQLIGLDLNAMKVSDVKATYGVQWVYKSADELQRSVNEVFIDRVFICGISYI
jgi:type I restriction enzyme R subunit